MTKERKFKKAYAEQLLRIARGDLDSARGLIKARMGRTENILFLAQQAIEKGLKAVLCYKEIPVPLVHEIAIILDRFPKSLPVPETDGMMDLDQFATIRRYEEGQAELTQAEVDSVVNLATRTLDWAGSIIES